MKDFFEAVVEACKATFFVCALPITLILLLFTGKAVVVFLLEVARGTICSHYIN